MKKIFQLSALALLPASTNLYANHPAADTVEEETYTMTDSFVADTPNAIPGFDEMGSGMTKTTITTDSLSMFETLAARGDLLEYIELLDGAVNASINFNDNGSVTVTVNQVS